MAANLVNTTLANGQVSGAGGHGCLRCNVPGACEAGCPLWLKLAAIQKWPNLMCGQACALPSPRPERRCRCHVAVFEVGQPDITGFHEADTVLSLDTDATGSLTWLIVPTEASASVQQGAKRFYVGGSLL